MHGRGGCRGRGAGRSGAPSSVPLPHDDPAHWGRVRSALAGAPLRSVRDLQQALSHYNSATAACTFSPLVMLLSGDPAQEREFFGARLHGIIGLALELPALFPSRLPVLDRAPCRAALTRKQVASLLANIFLSTFPERRRARGQAEAHALSPVDCLVLFGLGEGRGGQEGGDAGSDARLCAEKLKCLLHYFGFALQRLREDGAWAAETVEVVRRGSPTRGTDWRASAARLGDITVTVRSEGRIEEAAADFEADFANAHVGGGVLGRGCVQEEIRFLIAPELIVSKVLCSRLADDESLLICGAQVVSRYTGYRQSFRWSGPVHPPESEGATRRVVTVMDALDTHRHPARQFSRKHMVRELDKAAGAFARLSPPASACCGAQSNTVATGNWYLKTSMSKTSMSKTSMSNTSMSCLHAHILSSVSRHPRACSVSSCARAHTHTHTHTRTRTHARTHANTYTHVL